MQIKLYCKAHNKERLSRYEMIETQILRFKKWDTKEVTFKLYDYCKNDRASGYNKTVKWLVCFTPDNGMIPDSFYTDEPYIIAEVTNADDIVVFRSDRVKIHEDLFTLQLPRMNSGRYTLNITYNHDDVVTKSFPLIITN